jgi:hypothetical protein
MPMLIVPDPFTSKLAAADGPVELVAADGRRLGYFSPGPPKQYRLDPPGTPEEWEREFQAGGGRPLADILRDLEKRA